MRAYLLRGLTLLTALFVLTVPFPYQLLPSPGDYLAPLFAPLHRWLAQAVFHVPAPYTLAVRSDSTGLYLHALVLLALATLGAALWPRRWRPRPAVLWHWLHTGASYYLALQLLAYGFDKVFKHQFYLPEPNTLYTPLGQLTPDLLYWSVMGVSRPYTVFSGLMEVVPAALLLFQRTRAVGGLVALGVLLNVAALNLGFDISVKLYSLFLLLLSLVAACPALRLLYQGLIRRQAVAPADPAPHRPRPWLKAAVIGLLLLESVGPFVRAGEYNDDRTPRPPLHGAYQVEWLVLRGDTLRPEAAPGLPRRVFVHRQGYFIVQTAADSLRDYQLSYGPGRLHLLDYDSTRYQLRYQPAPGGRLLLTGHLGGPDSVRLLVRPLAWRRLPLLQPEFHWTTDSYR